MGLGWLQPTYSFPVTGDAQHHDTEHLETGNGNHVCTVIQLYIVIAVLCLCCDFHILQYHSAKTKYCVMSNIFK